MVGLIDQTANGQPSTLSDDAVVKEDAIQNNIQKCGQHFHSTFFYSHSNDNRRAVGGKGNAPAAPIIRPT